MQYSFPNSGAQGRFLKIHPNLYSMSSLTRCVRQTNLPFLPWPSPRPPCQPPCHAEEIGGYGGGYGDDSSFSLSSWQESPEMTHSYLAASSIWKVNFTFRKSWRNVCILITSLLKNNFQKKEVLFWSDFKSAKCDLIPHQTVNTVKYFTQILGQLFRSTNLVKCNVTCKSKHQLNFIVQEQIKSRVGRGNVGPRNSNNIQTN